MNYSWAGDTLTATGPRGVLFTVLVTDPATGAYKVTLLDNVLHAVVADGENATDPVTALPTDHRRRRLVRDGDAERHLRRRRPDGNRRYHRHPDHRRFTTGNLLSNDSFGADGVDIDNTPAAGQVFVVPGSVVGGSVIYNNNGTFTYTPTAGFNGTASFQYTIKDGDGDTSTATVTLNNVHTNSIPTAGAVTGTVDDEGLANGIASGTGDVAGQDFSVSGTLTHDYNTDGKAAVDPVNFSLMNGVTTTVGTESVTYAWNAASNTLTANSNAGRGAIFTVVVDGGSDSSGAGNYVFTLLKPVLHASGSDENDATVALTYQVKDSNADTATGNSTITIDDDTPVATPDSKTVTEGGNNSVNLTLIVDVSGSMDDDADGNGPGTATRLQVAKAALVNLSTPPTSTRS